MNIKCSHSELLGLHKLVPHPKNPHKHTKEQIDRLSKIIEFQGQRHPVIISRQSGYIVVGHGRLEAIKKLGWGQVAVDYQDFENEAQEYAFIVSDNAIGKDEWAVLDRSMINTDILDFGPELDIDLLGIKDFELVVGDTLEPQTDEDEVPEVEDPITKRGDIWILGKHRLMCGDSTMIDDVEKLMNGEKAEMVFTDPPYNQETEGGFNGEIGKALRKQSSEIEHLCDFNPTDFLNMLPNFFNKKMNTYVFCNKDLVPDYLLWAKNSGYSFNILFWKKPNAIPIGGSYRPDVEYLLVFRKSGIFNGSLKDVSYSKCLEFSREKNKVHPTMKPIEMIENQLKIASNNGSLVVDTFLGSGSTLIACEKTNRKCYGMELDENYCDVIINRWQNYTGKQAKLELTGELYNVLKNDKYLIDDNSDSFTDPYGTWNSR